MILTNGIIIDGINYDVTYERKDITVIEDVGEIKVPDVKILKIERWGKDITEKFKKKDLLLNKILTLDIDIQNLW